MEGKCHGTAVAAPGVQLSFLGVGSWFHAGERWGLVLRVDRMAVKTFGYQWLAFFVASNANVPTAFAPDQRRSRPGGNEPSLSSAGKSTGSNDDICTFMAVLSLPVVESGLTARRDEPQWPQN